MAELLDQQLCRILVDRLVDGDHHVEIEQFLHEVRAFLAHPLGKLADGDGFGHYDIADLLFARL